MAMGIAEADIQPRENVLTFNAWKARGRSVKKGEHGVKVATFIICAGEAVRDPSTGEERSTTYRRPHTTTVFHISQTELTSDREARLASSPRRSAAASGHGRYSAVWRDPSGNGGHSNVPGYGDVDRACEDQCADICGR